MTELSAVTLLNLYAKHTMRNAGWMSYKRGGRNSNSNRYADDTTLTAESEEELKSLLMRGRSRVKEPA